MSSRIRERDARHCVTTLNNFPRSYFHNKENSDKLAFHLRELQFATSAPSSFRSPSFVFSFRPFVSFHPRSCCSIPFGGTVVRLLSNLSRANPGAISALYYVSAFFVLRAIRARWQMRRRRLLSRARNEICEASPMSECRSRNHFIVLQSPPRGAEKREIVAVAMSRVGDSAQCARFERTARAGRRATAKRETNGFAGRIGLALASRPSRTEDAWSIVPCPGKRDE